MALRKNEEENHGRNHVTSVQNERKDAYESRGTAIGGRKLTSVWKKAIPEELRPWLPGLSVEVLCTLTFLAIRQCPVLMIRAAMMRVFWRS